MFPEKQIFWQFKNVKNQNLFSNSQFSFYAVRLATSATIPDKVGETLTKTFSRAFGSYRICQSKISKSSEDS